jgi:predicted nucleotidyltransferase
MVNKFNHGLTDNDIGIITNILKPYKGIERIGFFGSRATGTYKPYSDIDMVLYGTVTEADGDHIQTLFIDSPLVYKVDVVVYHTIDHLPLKAHIDQSVQILYDKSQCTL